MSWKTPYADNASKFDDRNHPAPRGVDKCANCRNDWFGHYHWRCVTRLGAHNVVCTHDETPPQDRYLTIGMLDSLSRDGLERLRFELVSAPILNVPDVERRNALYDEVCARLQQKPTAPSVPVLSDWRAWRNDRPGECACGIAREQCEYHK